MIFWNGNHLFRAWTVGESYIKYAFYTTKIFGEAGKCKKLDKICNVVPGLYGVYLFVPSSVHGGHCILLSSS